MGENGYCKILVKDWETSFRKFMAAGSQSKKLTLLYLANDIIQKCKDKAPEFLQAFFKVFLGIFPIVAEKSDDSTIDDIQKLIQIWKTRKIYSTKNVSKLENSLGEKYQPIEMEAKDQELPDNLTSIPKELIEFVGTQKDLEKWVSKTAHSRKELEKILKGKDFDAEEADLLLMEYKRCLTLEQKYRTMLLKGSMELMRIADRDHIMYIENIKRLNKMIDFIESDSSKSVSMDV